ncbi:RHS repeat-associated core domain-containing protein [bacterium]|nr:RHS repeat-associated core domain-containing protein [bacterium]
MRTVTHAYDLNNRRISRLVDEGSNGSIENRDYFYYDGDNVVLTLAQNMAVEHRYLHGPKVDQILADEAFDESTGAFIDTYWPITDHQGSVRDVLSAPGVRSEHIRYSAFGQIVEVRNGSTIDPTKTPTVSYAYTGREWDPATSLQYNRNRWYDPSTGRWMSQDPIGFSAGDQNLYRYVENDAVNYTDPTGHGKGKIFVQLVKIVGCKLEPVGKPIAVTVEEAARLVPEGKNVLCESNAVAAKIAQKAGNGAPPVRDRPHPAAGPEARPHYHVCSRPKNWGHVFYSWTTVGTATYWMGDDGAMGWLGWGVDFVNPLAIPNDCASVYLWATGQDTEVQ